MPISATYHLDNRNQMDVLGAHVARMIAPNRNQFGAALDGVAPDAAFDVVAIIIIGGIILLTGET
jgi:hypothetical protein